MLKIEDLKVGDELEFISDESKELFYFRKVETKQEDTTSTLVNANIKNYEEMYKRLIDGEVFYYKDGIVSYGKAFGNFLYNNKLLGAYKSEFKNFQVQKPWWEFASQENPILCKVSGDGECGFNNIIGKTDFEDHNLFITDDGNYWDNAVPVKPSECFQGG